MVPWLYRESPDPLFSGDGLELDTGLLYALSPSSAKGNVVLSLVLHRVIIAERGCWGQRPPHL